MPKESKRKIAGEHFTWNLFERDGVWYADGRHNSQKLGKHSLGTRDREAALRALNELDHRKAVELKLAQPRPAANGFEELSIKDGWERYLKHVSRPAVLGGANHNTQKRYRAVKDKHLEFCSSHGTRHWGQIDKRAVAAYGSWLTGQKYADATIYLEATLLKQLVKWLIEEEKVLPESNRIRLPLKRSEESDRYCYTRDEVRAMVALCTANSNLHWLCNVIIDLATTGMRIGELVALRWSDVDFNAGVITLSDNRHSELAKRVGATRTTKGGRSRRLPIHPTLWQVLMSLPHRGQGGHVFRAYGGGRLDADKVLKVLKRDVIGALKEKFSTRKGEIGFEHGTVHSFRHFFVTEAFLGGATDGEVRDWVGHRDSRIVERYRHLRGSAAKQTMARLDFLGTKANDTPPANQNNATNGNGTREQNVPAADDTSNNSRGTSGPNVSGPQ